MSRLCKFVSFSVCVCVCVPVAGQLLVLDGLHRLRNDVLHVLHPLIYDREFHLPDGSLCVPAPVYDALIAKGAAVPCPPSDDGTQAATRPDGTSLYRIHPSFRILGLTDAAGALSIGSSSASPSKHAFPCSETLSLFTYHTVPDLISAHHRALLLQKCKGVKEGVVDKLLGLNDVIKAQSVGDASSSSSPALSPFSTRQLLRIGMRLQVGSRGYRARVCVCVFV